MKKYIALLRGINVGGINKVPMPELKVLFEQNGFFNVATYINSGNAIFSSGLIDTDKLKSKCECSLREKYPFDIPVAIIAAKDLSEALNNAPSWWNTEKDSKHNAIFVIPPVTVKEVFEQVGEAKPEYEKVGYYGRVIFWSAPLKTFSRTRWSKVVQSSVYHSVTIRNANTTVNLAQLAR